MHYLYLQCCFFVIKEWVKIFKILKTAPAIRGSAAKWRMLNLPLLGEMAAADCRNIARNTLIALAVVMLQQSAWAAVTGRITGNITDPSGGAISGASITVTNTAQGIETRATAGAKGDYSFPSLPVGTCDLLFDANG